MFSEDELAFAARKLSSATPSSLGGVFGILVGRNPSLGECTAQDLLDALKQRESRNGSSRPSATFVTAEREVAEMREDKAISQILEALDELRQAVKASNRIVVDYMIVSHKTQAGLNMEVQKWLPVWQPFGGPGAAAFGMSPVGGNNYFQALVKFKA